MALLKNKISNNIKKTVHKESLDYAENLKKKMQEQINNNLFVDAMDTMAEIAKLKMMDIEIMYMGAYCYLMTGDNERAAVWINNVLKYDPSNVKARILLARLCIVEDREEDGLAVYDFVLEKLHNKLTDEDKSELDELLDYYRYSDSEMIAENYPSIARFLNLENNEVENTDNTEYVTEETHEPANEETKIDDPAARAKAAVERLRTLLQKQREKDAVSMANDSKISSSNIKENISSDEDKKSLDSSRMEMENKEESFDVAGVTAKIMKNNVSLREKVKMFNTFAAGCYVNGDYQSAFDLLNGALLLDDEDPIVLRNIAYVCIAAGENEQAMEFASKLPMIDFSILHSIK